MANMNVNKVIYGVDVLIDLTGDSVSADKVLKGITAKPVTRFFWILRAM